MRTVAKVAAAVVGVILALVLIALFVLTQTRWGQQKVGNFALGTVASSINGKLSYGSVEGNPLSGLTLHDVALTDSAGRPFLKAGTLKASYDIGSLIHRHIDLNSLTMANGRLVLEKPPAQDWNFKRVFGGGGPPDTTAAPGFGSWVRFNDVTLRNVDVVVRQAWSPADSLAPSVRQAEIAQALSGAGRFRVERVPGGYERVIRLLNVDAHLPLVRLADPDKPGILAKVDRLNTLAEPFATAPVRISNLAGTFAMPGDTLFLRNVELSTPHSQVTLEGRYVRTTGNVALSGTADPFDARDMQWLSPKIPAEAHGALAFTYAMNGAESHVEARNADVALGDASVKGSVSAWFGRTFRLGPGHLTFSGVGTDLVHRFVPSFQPPEAGTFRGDVALSGTPAKLNVDGDVTFVGRRSGTSRLAAEGPVGFAGSGIHADGLTLRMHPVDVALLRELGAPDSLTGTLTGTATLNGSTTGRMAAALDLTHHGAAGASHVTGDVALRLPGISGLDADLRLEPLRLATVGRVVPGVGLRGTAAGRLRLSGAPADLSVNADLAFVHGGGLGVTGTIGLGQPVRYDLDARLRGLDLAAVSTRGPVTSLTGTASATGTGFDPATMNARVTADLAGSSVDSIGADVVRADLALADGLLRVDTAVARVASGSLALNGSFGLTAGRTGTLSYALDVGSAADFARWLPVADTGVVAPRPARMAERIRTARADSLRRARATEVERAATGMPPEPTLAVDTLQPLPKDSVAGTLHTHGTVSGNLKSFDLAGSATTSGLVAKGVEIGSGEAAYGWQNAPSPAGALRLDMALGSVRMAGFALDTVRAKIRQQGMPSADRTANGTADVAVVQDTARAYRLRADYALDVGSSRVNLNDVALRFDTTTWQSTQPGSVIWGGSGFEVAHLELVNGEGGRIFVDGRLPTNGNADLRVAVDSLPVRQVMALLQDSLGARGLLSLHATVNGDQAAPVVSGDAALRDGFWGGTALPYVAANFDYAAGRLATDALMRDSVGNTLVSAKGTLPIYLGMSGEGPHLLDQPLSLSVDADSLPIGLASSMIPSIQDVRGGVSGHFQVAGTPHQPQVTGDVGLELASARVVPAGITLRDVAGHLVLRSDSLVIDSLVAHTGGHPVRVSGGVGLASLTRPSFDVAITSDNAVFLNNEQGTIRASTDLQVQGPFDDVHVTGRIAIEGGVFYIPQPRSQLSLGPDNPAVFQVVDTTKAGARQLVNTPSPFLSNLTVDVQVTVARDVWARNTEANLELFTPEDAGPLMVHMDRSTGDLTVVGVVETGRGQYVYMGRRFEIRSGSVRFVGDPDINPLLQLTAGHAIRLPGQPSVQIQIVLGGTMRSPRISLESDAQPPIPQDALLSYLAFGRSSTSLLQQNGSALSGPGSASGNLVGNVASMATQQMAAAGLGALAGGFSLDAARQLGVDYFTVSPADLPPEATPAGVSTFLRGTEVDVGKYLNPRTFVSAHVRPTFASPGVQVEYTTPIGFGLDASWQPRFLPAQPSLGSTTPAATSVFGLFLFKEWKW